MAFDKEPPKFKKASKEEKASADASREAADAAQLKIWMEEAAREGISDPVAEEFSPDLQTPMKDEWGPREVDRPEKKEEPKKVEPPAREEARKKEEPVPEPAVSKAEKAREREPQAADKPKEETVEGLKDKIQEYLNQISRLQADFRKKSDEEPVAKAKAPEPSIPKEEPRKKEEPKMEEKVMRAEKPAEKIKEESIESLKDKNQDYRSQIVRLQADFANFRKRAEKEKIEAIRFGREVILEQMIGLNDVMENALKHAQSATDVSSLKKGFEMVVQEFTRFLKSEGAEPLKTVGQPFDPHMHEAVETVETENEKENNVIVEELQKGYILDGRLLRPAKVKVAKFKEDK